MEITRWNERKTALNHGELKPYDGELLMSMLDIYELMDNRQMLADGMAALERIAAGTGKTRDYSNATDNVSRALRIAYNETDTDSPWLAGRAEQIFDLYEKLYDAPDNDESTVEIAKTLLTALLPVRADMDHLADRIYQTLVHAPSGAMVTIKLDNDGHRPMPRFWSVGDRFWTGGDQ